MNQTARKILTVVLILWVLTLSACNLPQTDGLDTTSSPSLPSSPQVDAAGEALPEDAPAVFYYDVHGEKHTLQAEGDYPTAWTDEPEIYKFRLQAYVRVSEGGIAVNGEVYSQYEGGLADYASHHTSYHCGDWMGDESGVYLRGEAVIPETCVGLLASYSRDRILIFTTREDTTLVYGAISDGEAWSLNPEPLVSVSGKSLILYLRWHSVNADCPDYIYLLTDQTVARVAVGDFIIYDKYGYESVTAVEYVAPDYWEHIHPSSVAMLDDYFYIGDRLGVVALRVSTGDFFYYPVNIFNT